MNDYLFIIPIAIAAIIGVMSPGPSFIFVAQTTLSKSRQHGIATSLGMGTGAVFFTLVACFGLFVVLEMSPFLYGTLKFVGGLYLLYLAYKIWKSSDEDSSMVEDSNTADGSHTADGSNTADGSKALEGQTNTATKSKYKNDNFKAYVKSYFLGLLTQLSNPKTAIVIGSFIMAFLPQEVPPYSFLIIAIITMIIDSGWYCIVSIALSTASAQKVYNRFKVRINRVASGLMGILGLKLAFDL